MVTFQDEESMPLELNAIWFEYLRDRVVLFFDEHDHVMHICFGVQSVERVPEGCMFPDSVMMDVGAYDEEQDETIVSDARCVGGLYHGRWALSCPPGYHEHFIDMEGDPIGKIWLADGLIGGEYIEHLLNIVVEWA